MAHPADGTLIDRWDRNRRWFGIIHVLEREFPNYRFTINYFYGTDEVVVTAKSLSHLKSPIDIPHPSHQFPDEAFFAKCILVL